MAFSGQDPKLKLYDKRNKQLCEDFFVHKFCARGETCHFAHSVATVKSVNEKWKTSYCPNFFNGNCDRGILCNFKHDPNKIRNPIKKFCGEDLIIELRRLNPFGYREEKAMSPPAPPEEKLNFVRTKRLEMLNVPEKVEKVEKVEKLKGEKLKVIEYLFF